MSIDIPEFNIKLVSNIFYGSATRAQSVPLLVASFKIDSSISDWSSNLDINTNIILAADIFHETRNGFEALIEKVEVDQEKPGSRFAEFQLGVAFRQYAAKNSKFFSDEFTEDDFEHVDRLPKQKLEVTTKHDLNLNVSSESINIINHLVSTFNDGFQAAKRGTSSTHVLQSSKTSVGDAKAPITVLNETGHDVTFTPCTNWHELDFVDSRHSLRSFSRVHPSDGSDSKNVNFCMRTFSISKCFLQGVIDWLYKLHNLYKLLSLSIFAVKCISDPF